MSSQWQEAAAKEADERLGSGSGSATATNEDSQALDDAIGQELADWKVERLERGSTRMAADNLLRKKHPDVTVTTQNDPFKAKLIELAGELLRRPRKHIASGRDSRRSLTMSEVAGLVGRNETVLYTASLPKAAKPDRPVLPETDELPPLPDNEKARIAVLVTWWRDNDYPVGLLPLFKKHLKQSPYSNATGIGGEDLRKPVREVLEREARELERYQDQGPDHRAPDEAEAAARQDRRIHGHESEDRARVVGAPNVPRTVARDVPGRGWSRGRAGLLGRVAAPWSGGVAGRRRAASPGNRVGAWSGTAGCGVGDGGASPAVR